MSTPKLSWGLQAARTRPDENQDFSQDKLVAGHIRPQSLWVSRCLPLGLQFLPARVMHLPT